MNKKPLLTANSGFLLSALTRVPGYTFEPGTLAAFR